MKKIRIKQDKQLLQRLRAGDKRSVRDWHALYFNDLLRVAIFKTSNPDDAEEIVQETFINCLRHLPLFQGKSSIKTWMMSIMRHEIADYFRKKYAKKAIKLLPLVEEILASPLVSSGEIDHWVRTTLAEMTKEKKELLLMKYVDKLKVKEIASKLGKSVKSIESDLFRARREFRGTYLKFSNR